MSLKTRFGIAVAAVMSAGLMAGAAQARASDFLGNWSNVNSNTRDITRVIVTPSGGGHVKVRVFGQCRPHDCDWGTVNGRTYSRAVNSGDVRVVTARFNQGFKRTLVILRVGPGGRMRYTALNDFTDSSGRRDYESTGALKKAAFVPHPGPHPLPALGREDCISFNPSAVRARHVGGAWKVVQGSMWMLDFGSKKAQAMRAAHVIRQYRFNRQCFVRRPHAAMMYWKVGNRVPGNPLPHQDCTANNPATTRVAHVGGRWKVVDGSHWMLDFGGDRAAARQALAVIKHYRLNRQCFIARPNAEMTYWLSQ